MPTIVVEDDVVIRSLQVVLDPDTDPERQAAIADYLSVDVPDFDGWRDRVRAAFPSVCPSRVINVSTQEELLAALPERPAEADYRAILCDRHNEPWGIYTKEPPGGSIKGLRTVASVLFEPAAGQAWMSHGGAGNAAMTRFTVQPCARAA